MLPHLSWLALGLATTAVAQDAGSIVEAGDTLVSAMMVRPRRPTMPDALQLFFAAFPG